MCLITTQQKPITTDKDIICYKLVETMGKEVYSYFHSDYKWTRKTIHKVKISESSDFNTFDVKEIIKRSNYISIGRGFHAVLTRERLRKDRVFGTREGEFLIPKGSEIYYGVTDLIVSNQMIFIKLLKE